MHPFIDTQKEAPRYIPPFRAGDTLRVNVPCARATRKDFRRSKVFASPSAEWSQRDVHRAEISNGIGVEAFPDTQPDDLQITVFAADASVRKLY